VRTGVSPACLASNESVGVVGEPGLLPAKVVPSELEGDAGVVAEGPRLSARAAIPESDAGVIAEWPRLSAKAAVPGAETDAGVLTEWPRLSAKAAAPELKSEAGVMAEGP
jgi:hypothetical protein